MNTTFDAFGFERIIFLRFKPTFEQLITLPLTTVFLLSMLGFLIVTELISNCPLFFWSERELIIR